MNFDKLEKIMELNGIVSLAEIARNLNTTPQAVSNWKARNQVPNHVILEVNEKLTTKDLSALEKELKADIEKNNDFRIKWPRGEMGTLPADSEQFMLLEHMATQVEKILKDLCEMMHNKVNIERLQKDVEKILSDVEKLKDKVRANGKNYE